MTEHNQAVQKHRAKLTTEDCARIEVTLQRGLIDQTREMARETRRPLWEVVQAALIAYVTGYPAKIGNAK